MKKRLLSILIAISMMLPFIPNTMAFAEATVPSGGKEIDQSVYDALGLKTDDSAGKDLYAPYGTGTSQLMSAREVYVSAVGNVASTSTLRDGFNRMNYDSEDAHRKSDDGNLSGAYQFYGINKSSIKAGNGDTRGSRLSDNSSNVISKTTARKNGIYATSTAFNMGSNKDNYIAELVALNDESTKVLDGTRVTGDIKVYVYQIGEDGNKIEKAVIAPKVNSNQVYKGDGDSSYFTYFARRYVQDLDAIFEIKAADIDGDGTDEIFVYTGRYEDRNGQRYALVEYFKVDGTAYVRKGDIEIKAGTSRSYRDLDLNVTSTQWDYILRHPIVTLAGGDLNRDGKEEIAVTVSPPNSNGDTKSVSRAKVFEWKDNTIQPIAELSDILLNNGTNAVASANCTFGDFTLPGSSIAGTALIMAGYQTFFNNTHESNNPYSKAGYRYVYFDPVAGINGAYKISDYKDYSSVSNSAGADISQSISVTTNTEHAIEVYGEVNGKMGGGFALMGNKLVAGVVASSHAGFTTSTSTSKGTSYSGTIDNLPNEATQYGFSWKLLVNQATLNGAPTWIVGYNVKDVSEPPRMPQNLSVSNANADSIDLTWESSGSAAYYELSMVTQDGEYNKFATLPYTVESYTATELQSNTSYTFSIRAVNANGATSIDSPHVTAYTLNDKANFSVTTQPEDTSAAAGLSASFSAVGQYLDANGISKSVGYEWYHKVSNKSSWEKIIGAGTTDSTLNISNVTPEMDGRKYRCRIYYQKQSLYTQPAMLTVDRSQSEIELGELKSDIVNSGGVKTEYEETVVLGRKTVTQVKEDKTYVLNNSQDGEAFYWSDGDDYYIFKSTLPILDSNGDVLKDSAFTADNIGDVLSKTEKDYTASFRESTALGMENVALVDADMDETAPTFVEDGITYEAKAKWTTKKEGFTDYAFYKAEVESQITTAYFYKKTADDTNSTVFSLGWTDVIDNIDISTLTTSFQVTETKTTQTKETTVTGDTVKIVASPKATNDLKSLEGNVTFAISGTGGETLTATKQSDGTYAANWNPNAEGKYTITARFAGNDIYYSSESDPVTVYTVMKDNAILTLTAPANLTYGNSAAIATTQISNEDGTNKYKDVTRDDATTYTVKKLGDKNEYVEATAGDYTLNKDEKTFTPKLSTNFLITAMNGESTSDVVIAVSKGVLNIEAQNTTKSLNDSDRKPVDAKITGAASWDNISLTKNTDYKITTEGEKAALPGTFAITISLLDSDTMKGLAKNYSVQVKNATYTLESKSYIVKASALTNGSVSISYDNQGTSVAVESGTKLPENCKTTITATPAQGYAVGKWERKVNGMWSAITTNGSFDTSLTQVISKLSSDEEYRVSFEPKYTTLTFKANDQANGTVTGNYLTNSQVGATFQSGGNIHVNNTVRLTATSINGYVVSEWSVDRGAGNVEIIKVSGVDTNYTGTG